MSTNEKKFSSIDQVNQASESLVASAPADIKPFLREMFSEVQSINIE